MSIYYREDLRRRLVVLCDEVAESCRELPARFVVCPRCRGRGVHVNPAIDGHGLTAEDVDQAGPEFLEDYLAGVYDVACERCGGRRVVLEPDPARLTAAQLGAWHRVLDLEAEAAGEAMLERRQLDALEGVL